MQTRSIAALLSSVLLFSLSGSPRELAAQIRGTVYFDQTADSGAAERVRVSGYIVRLSDSTLGVETLQGPIVVERGDIRRVELLHRRTADAGMLGITAGTWLGMYLTAVSRGGSGGPAGLPTAFVDDGWEAEGRLALFGGLGLITGGLVGGGLDVHLNEARESFHTDREWEELSERLEEGRKRVWSLTIHGGNLFSFSRQDIFGRIADVPLDNVTDRQGWELTSSTQMLRRLELTRAITPTVSVGGGLHDLSIGGVRGRITTRDEGGFNGRPIVRRHWTYTSIVGSGYSGMAYLHPSLRTDEERSVLTGRVGVGLGLAGMRVRETMPINMRANYRIERNPLLPYATLAADASLYLHGGLSLGLGADLFLVPPITLRNGGTPLPADSDPVVLTSGSLGFVIGYRF